MSSEGVTVMPYGPLPRGASNASISPVAGSRRPIDAARAGEPQDPVLVEDAGVRPQLAEAGRHREDVDVEVARGDADDRVGALVGHPGGAVRSGDHAVRRRAAREVDLVDLAGRRIEPAESPVPLARVPDAPVRGGSDVVRMGAIRHAVGLGGERQLADGHRGAGEASVVAAGSGGGSGHRGRGGATRASVRVRRACTQPVEACGSGVELAAGWQATTRLAARRSGARRVAGRMAIMVFDTSSPRRWLQPRAGGRPLRPTCRRFEGRTTARGRARSRAMSSPRPRAARPCRRRPARASGRPRPRCSTLPSRTSTDSRTGNVHSIGPGSDWKRVIPTYESSPATSTCVCPPTSGSATQASAWRLDTKTPGWISDQARRRSISALIAGTTVAEVADDRVVRDGHDRRVGVRVDREDPLRGLAADDVLDRAADAAGDVQVRRDAEPGLADLVRVRPPAEARHDARAADGAAEQRRRAPPACSNPSAEPDAAAAADDDLCLGERDAGRGLRLAPDDPATRSAGSSSGSKLVTVGAGALLVPTSTRDGVRRHGEQPDRRVERRVLEQAAGPALAHEPPRTHRA